MKNVNQKKLKTSSWFQENLRRLVLVAALLLLAALLSILLRHMTDNLTDQGMAQRWSKAGDVAQVSCFFSSNMEMTEERLEEFEHTMEGYLTENSIELQSQNPGARLWVSAYSGEGKISVKSDRGSVDADALGVGGDFFLFHPQRLIYGNYFSGNDLNQDYCIIDEDAAWQLFGSNDVAGMLVSISGIPHIVAGVVERPKGKLVKAAGLDTTRIYVSYQTLKNYGTSHGINHYEILMPDPVKQFAYKYVKEQLGSDEKEVEIIENSTRFGLLRRWKLIADFGTRSMNGKAIIYPYWENVARGYEDIAALLTLLTALVLIYPVLFLLLSFIYWWRHKGWTFRGISIKIRDRIERVQEEYYQKKKLRKEKTKKEKAKKEKT